MWYYSQSMTCGVMDGSSMGASSGEITSIVTCDSGLLPVHNQWGYQRVAAGGGVGGDMT